MRRFVSLLMALVVALSFTATFAGPAEAKKKKRDTPGCVSRGEYAAVHSGMTQAQVAQLFDTQGAQIASDDDGYWVDESYWTGAWVYDGYWEDGYTDWDGTYVPGYFVDLSYWDDFATYVEDGSWRSMMDTARSYKKCKSFQRGRGRVGIEFDNYSYGSGMRVFTKTPRNPYLLTSLVYLRTTARTMGHGKPLPAH